MQNPISFHPNVRMTLAAACLCASALCALALSGCSTTQKTADATPPAGTKGLTDRGSMLAKDSMLPRGSVTAKSGTTPSSLHVDAASSRTSARQAAHAQPGVQALTPEQAAALVGSTTVAKPESSFPPAPAAPQQTSIAGLSTQPTGVRADSGTIFSANPPPPLAATNPNGPVPADLPRRNFNAMTASVFSMPHPTASAACGTDAQGNPLSC